MIYLFYLLLFGLWNLGLNNMIAYNLPGSSPESLLSTRFSRFIDIHRMVNLREEKAAAPGLMGLWIFLFDGGTVTVLNSCVLVFTKGRLQARLIN